MKNIHDKAEHSLAGMDDAIHDKVHSAIDQTLDSVSPIYRFPLRHRIDSSDIAVHFFAIILPIVIFFLSSNRWAIESWVMFTLLTISFTSSIIILWLFYRKFNRRLYPHMAITMLVCSFIIIALHVFAFERISSQCPRMVSRNETVKGLVPFSMNDNYLYSVIYSNHGKGWVQEIGYPDANNSWSSDCIFAGSSNTPFDLMIYASEKDLGLFKGNEVRRDFFIKKGVVESRCSKVKVR